MRAFEAYRGAVRWRSCVCAFAIAGDRWPPVRRTAAESYAIAMHGEPALPADFTHMPYANPDAPKGGRLV